MVLLWSSRDELVEAVRPRLDALGADASRMVAVQSMADDEGAAPQRPLDVSRGLEASDIGSAVERVPGCTLAIIDALGLRLMPGGGLDESSSNLLAALARLAARRSVALVAVVQVEGKSYGAALDHATQCLAAHWAVASLWRVDCERRGNGPEENERDGRRRRWSIVKHRAGPEPGPLDFDLTEGRVNWLCGLVRRWRPMRAEPVGRGRGRAQEAWPAIGCRPF